MTTGWTQLHPDGTTTWADGATLNADLLNGLGVDGAPSARVPKRERTTKAQRRRAKTRLACHRALLRAEVDSLNPWGVLKREYTGTTGVAAMVRDMGSCSRGHWCAPLKWVRW